MSVLAKAKFMLLQHLIIKNDKRLMHIHLLLNSCQLFRLVLYFKETKRNKAATAAASATILTAHHNPICYGCEGSFNAIISFRIKLFFI